MHIEFLVEESSADAALHNLLPKMLGDLASYSIHAFQGKRDLLAKLPARRRAYRSWSGEDGRIVVLIDADVEDCRELKALLEAAARNAGFVTRSAAGGSRFQVLNRLAVEELEAWFFGDIPALQAAYPRLGTELARRAHYRTPDAIKGGTWEALERELQRRGYFPGGLPKVEVARTVSTHMEPERNRSHSFQLFRQGLLEPVGLP